MVEMRKPGYSAIEFSLNYQLFFFLFPFYTYVHLIYSYTFLSCYLFYMLLNSTLLRTFLPEGTVPVTSLVLIPSVRWGALSEGLSSGITTFIINLDATLLKTERGGGDSGSYKG